MTTKTNTKNWYNYKKENSVKEDYLTCNNNEVYYEFKYNAAGQLTHKWKDDTLTEDEEIIEENEYRDGKLYFRKTFYFGIDPCCMKYSYRFDYYQ